MKGSKPSSVLDGHLSRPWLPRTGHLVASVTALDFRPRRATCKRPIRRLLRGGLPFSLRWSPTGLVSVALTRRTVCQSGLSTARSSRIDTASPAFTGHPRSVQLGLSSDPNGPATILPSSTLGCERAHHHPDHHNAPNDEPAGQATCCPGRPWCRRGDLNSHEVTLTTP